MPKIKVEQYQCDWEGCKTVEQYEGNFRSYKKQNLCAFHFSEKTNEHEHKFTDNSNVWIFIENDADLSIEKMCEIKNCLKTDEIRIDLNKNKEKFKKFIEECKKDD